MTTRQPAYSFHPGEVLADELAVLHASPMQLAHELGVSLELISELLAGQRAMTNDLAGRLEQWLSVEAAFWMNLQRSYERDEAARHAQMGDRPTSSDTSPS